MEKSIVQDGVTFVLAGTCGCEDQIINAYFGKKYPRKADPAAGFAIDGGRVYVILLSQDDGFQKYEAYPPAAAGTGTAHALTAMDLGCDAREAVKMAMKRDANTGGKIRVIRVK